jgi:hypothetical protein
VTSLLNYLDSNPGLQRGTNALRCAHQGWTNHFRNTASETGRIPPQAVQLDATDASFAEDNLNGDLGTAKRSAPEQRRQYNTEIGAYCVVIVGVYFVRSLSDVFCLADSKRCALFKLRGGGT